MTSLLGGVLFVEGTPAPQGSKAFKGFRAGRAVLVESSKSVGAWREQIAWHARSAMRGRGPATGAVDVSVEFVMPRPTSTPKTRPTPRAIKQPDADKLARACGDALAGICYVDDAQIVEWRIVKRIAEIGETAGVYIEVHGEDQP